LNDTTSDDAYLARCPPTPQKQKFVSVVSTPTLGQTGHFVFLLNHLVGAGKQRGLDAEAERLGGSEVDYKNKRLHSGWGFRRD
jgi:hypothetical protein